MHSYTGLYISIKGYTQLYWAIQRYTQVYRANNNTQIYRARHSYTGLYYRAIHSYTRLYTAFKGLYTAILGYTEVYTTWESEWVTGLHRLLVWFWGLPRMIALQLDFWKNYERLKAPMMKTTQEKVNDLVSRLHQGEHIDDMTTKWLLQTPNPPRVPIFYTLTKIHKSKPVGRPIISGCERISSFVDTLLQPIAQKQKSFIKDTTDFISFIEKTKIGKDTI